jgi:hypothetical protein
LDDIEDIFKIDTKTKLESNKLSDKCFVNIYISKNEASYILELDYLNGRFVSQKIFPNSLDGVAYMEETKDLFKNEDDIKKYFGII